MLSVDRTILIILVVSVLLGLLFGFSRGLKFFSNGKIGTAVSIIICYFIFGTVLNFAFVQRLLEKFLALFDTSKWYLNVLCKLRIELVAFAIGLFILVQFLRKLLTEVVANTFSSDTKAMRILNKILGILLFVLMYAVLLLVFFQIVYWVDGLDGSFYEKLSGSVIKLDNIYANNPLKGLIESIRLAKGE